MRLSVTDHEFFMGLSFLSSCKIAKNKDYLGALLVKGNRIVSNSLEFNDTSCEYELLNSYEGDTVGCDLYITRTPSFESLSLIKTFNFNLIYFETNKIDLRSLELVSSSPFSILKFNGNLNWIRDQIKKLEQNDIFV